jgi:hypothetical protein
MIDKDITGADTNAMACGPLSFGSNPTSNE